MIGRTISAQLHFNQTKLNLPGPLYHVTKGFLFFLSEIDTYGRPFISESSRNLIKFSQYRCESMHQLFITANHQEMKTNSSFPLSCEAMQPTAADYISLRKENNNVLGAAWTGGNNKSLLSSLSLYRETGKLLCRFFYSRRVGLTQQLGLRLSATWPF